MQGLLNEYKGCWTDHMKLYQVPGNTPRYCSSVTFKVNHSAYGQLANSIYSKQGVSSLQSWIH